MWILLGAELLVSPEYSQEDLARENHDAYQYIA
jgi:hypothetical protein